MQRPRVVLRLLAAAAAAAAASADAAAAAASGCFALSAQVGSSLPRYHTPDVAVMCRNMVLQTLPSVFSICVPPAPSAAEVATWTAEAEAALVVALHS